jgi:malate/lactate dehydrogenase
MKIGVVGAGMVGATSAYAMLMRGIGREIVLVDKNKQRAEAESEDLNHAVPFVSPILVRAGDYADLAGAKVIVLAAGVNQKPGESRTHLLRRNADIFAQVVPDCLQHAADAVFVVATNPVDVLTHQAAMVAAKSGIDKSRVIGSGHDAGYRPISFDFGAAVVGRSQTRSRQRAGRTRRQRSAGLVGRDGGRATDRRDRKTSRRHDRR